MIMKNKRIIHGIFSRSASYNILHKYTQKHEIKKKKKMGPKCLRVRDD